MLVNLLLIVFHVFIDPVYVCTDPLLSCFDPYPRSTQVCHGAPLSVGSEPDAPVSPLFRVATVRIHNQ